jgi:uncharacterized protein with beta-barrel porin domain
MAQMGWRPETVSFLALAVVAALLGGQVRAQVVPLPAARFIPPTPVAPMTDLSAGAGVIDLGSSFLERLGDQSSGGLNRASRSNPGGGGASETLDGQTFRTWGELYGISSKTGPQANFFGDERVTSGGVAGIGARVAPGVNVGFSVDQSRTGIDVLPARQTATLDLTQLGFNASIDKGPWTWATALVHGFGTINSMRGTALGTASANYTGQIDGALTELSYYWTADQSRLVPKAAFEYVNASTGSFQEMGGFAPVSASGATLERSRMLLGAEIGHYWIVDHKILDISAYGKFVDNFEQNLSSVTVSLGPQSIMVQGIGESRYGADAGASLSVSLSNAMRLYLNYDGKFRSALQSHQATMGVELKW